KGCRMAVFSVLLEPDVAGERVDGHAEAVTMAFDASGHAAARGRAVRPALSPQNRSSGSVSMGTNVSAPVGMVWTRSGSATSGRRKVVVSPAGIGLGSAQRVPRGVSIRTWS